VSTIAPKQLAWLSHELGTMLDAGLPIRRVLSVLRDAAKKASLRAALSDVARRVEGGSTLQEAFGAHKAFPPLFVNLIAVGEQSGTLDRIARELARFYESQWRIRRDFVASITLPALQYVIAVAVISAALYIVGVLSGRPTHLGRHLALGYGIPAAAIALYWLLARGVGPGSLFQKLLLKVPILGKVTSYLALARFSLAMHLMLHTGTPLRKALQYSLGATNNAAFTGHFHGMATAVEGGATLREALERTRLFPPEYLEVVSIGEEAGKLSERFDWLAAHYDEKAQGAMKVLAGAIAATVWVCVAAVIIAFIFKLFLGYLGTLKEFGL